MITVYTVAYNEELQIQFLTDHYRNRFSDCHIVVYDNMSDDKTVEIAKANNCEVIPYDTNNQINDRKYLEIKNNCWKNAETDWVLICDVDELLDINQEQLKLEENNGTTVITSEGYNMVNMEDNFNLHEIKYGARHTFSDKSYLFNKKFISEINYEAGCHRCNPIGKIVQSSVAYKAYHYNFINIESSIKKYESYAKRLSPENLKNGWGSHYLFPAEKVKAEFLEIRKKAIKLF